MPKTTVNEDVLSVEFVRSAQDRPGARRLVAVDEVGKLHLMGEELDALGHVVRRAEVEIRAAHLDHFAGMLMDATCLSDKHDVSLDEPIYPYRILVKWEGVHRVLSFSSRPTPEYPKGKIEFRIRLSPLEARRLARLAERCADSSHSMARLDKAIARLEETIARLEETVARLEAIVSKLG